jgi:hypothetical protein
MLDKLAPVNAGTRHSYWIVPTTPEHVYALADSLRARDADELEATGVKVKRALWRGYRRSLWCRTAFVDGDIAAIWGLNASALSNYGVPWLLTAPAVERVPFAIRREAGREVAKMLALCPVLENHVLASYAGAVRLLQSLGFTVFPAEPTGRNGALLSRFRLER